MEKDLIPLNYPDFIKTLKEQVKSAQVKAALSVNQQLVILYWEIGKKIIERQVSEGWGTKIIDRISRDLSNEFPDIKGFSVRNLKYIRSFVEAWPDMLIVQQLVAQIPWGHNLKLLDRVKDPGERVWYIQQTIQNAWSRNVLELQIEKGLYRRQGKAVTNLEKTLPSPQSDLAREIIKDPYNFDFLSLGKDAREREVEKELVRHVRNFLLELGKGFAFVGNQFHLEVDGKDFYIDLVFYHLTLRCYVLVDLKMGEFEPEFAGKMAFYLTAVDKQIKHRADKASIGIILCKSKNKVVAEYSIDNINRPVGISEFCMLPVELKENLPSVEQLEKELTCDV